MFTITEGIIQDKLVGLKYPTQNTMDVHTRRFSDAIMYNGHLCLRASSSGKLSLATIGAVGKISPCIADKSLLIYNGSKTSRSERFETASKKELYRTEFHARRKRRTEDWASFAENVKGLDEQVFNNLKSDMREPLVLTHYLQRIRNPQVDFSVKQETTKKHR